MGEKRRKSKTSSATSKPIAKPPEPIFFLDRAIESKVVLTRLREVGVIVEPHSAHFAPDEEDPVFARVHSIVEYSEGTVVHLELLPGDPMEYAEALQRAHLLAS